MRLKYWNIGLMMTSLLMCWNAGFAQLEIRQLESYPSSSTARILNVRDTLDLPFWDDFSFADVMPDSTLWEINKGVLINGTQGKESPTINVASFDGNTLVGDPHNPSSVVSEIADQLTSQPIDLSKVAEAKRATVYLSFFWQMAGYGEIPESKDSLKVEFLTASDEWIRVFEKVGIEDNLFAEFTRAAIALDREDYFHSGFQFRFTSVGNGGGPYDAWHVDYVFLNQDRVDGHEDLEDRAIASVPASIFREYTMIPYDVLFDFPDTIFQDISVELSQFDAGNRTVTLEYTLTDYKYLGTDSTSFDTLLYVLDKEGNLLLPGEIGKKWRVTNDVPALRAADLMGYDSLFLQSEMIFSSAKDGYFISSIDGLDTTFLLDEKYNYRLNDTVKRYHEVHHTLAYDDGTAEYAAGLNKNEARVAIYFNIPSQDTLTHIDIYFPQIKPSSVGKRIALSVMSGTVDGPDAIRRVQEFIIPNPSRLNEFSRFTFDVPIIVSGEFFITMQQFENEYIGIGLDNNNPIGLRKTFVMTNEEWKRNQKVEGILMMRPVFKKADLLTTAVVEPLERSIHIYPNPTDDALHIIGAFDLFTLFDISGRWILQGRDNQLNTQGLEEGVYLLKISHGPHTQTRKIVVRH